MFEKTWSLHEEIITSEHPWRGLSLTRLWHNREQMFIESDHNNHFLHSVRSLRIPIIMEDASLFDTLEAAHIEGAKGIIVVTSNDMTKCRNLSYCQSLSAKITRSFTHSR